MIIKEFPDGSELTGTGLLAALGAAAVMTVAVVWVQEKNNTRKTKKTMKKFGWPQKAIDKL